MKKQIFTAALLICAFGAKAQIAWTEPAQINANNPVKLFVDLKLTTCPNIGTGSPLPNVYIWTWKPSENLASGGNGMWDNSNEAHKLTHEGNNVWSITFSPSLAAFYNVTPQQAYSNGLAFLLKRDNGNTSGVCSGEAKTEDIMVPLVPSNVQDLQDADALQVTPNPASDQLNILLLNSGITTDDDVRVEIVDMTGKIVLNQTWDFGPLQIGELAAGQYMLRLVTEKQMWVKTIVKL